MAVLLTRPVRRHHVRRRAGTAIVPNDQQTVIAQVAGAVFGDGSLGFFLFLTFATLILMLAANTSFNAFPRLAAVLADDGFIPASVRLSRRPSGVHRGIVLLGVAHPADRRVRRRHPCAHPALRGRRVHRLHHQPVGHGPPLAAERARDGATGSRINAVGAVITGVVAVVVTGAKAPQSLVVVVVIPILATGMSLIRREYDTVGEELALRSGQVFEAPRKRNRVIIPVPGLSRAVVQSVQFGRSLSEDVRAVHITEDAD